MGIMGYSSEDWEELKLKRKKMQPDIVSIDEYEKQAEQEFKQKYGNEADLEKYRRASAPPSNVNEHQERIKDFMTKIKQVVYDTPTIPDEATRKLRIKIIFEEFCEL